MFQLVGISLSEFGMTKYNNNIEIDFSSFFNHGDQ